MRGFQQNAVYKLARRTADVIDRVYVWANRVVRV